MTTVKITELTDIGANLATSTVVPVVNMAGTPTTQKTNIGNIANLILEGAGVDYPEASVALLAQTVSNAAQPNITSVGTLTTLAVSGNATVNGNLTSNGTAYLGNISTTGAASITTLSVGSSANLGGVANVTITGGTDGYVLQTDGAGNLSWTAQTGGSGNATPGGSNTQIQFNDAGSFAGNSGFTFNKTTGVLTSPFLAGDGSNITNIIAGNPFNQELNTTDNVQFANVTSTEAIKFNNAGNIVGALGYAPTFVSIEGYGSNTVNITTNDVNTWAFNSDGTLSFPGNVAGESGNVLIDSADDNFEVRGAQAVNFEANTVVNIYTDTSNSAYQWQFGDDGNLTLPGNTFAVNYANGAQVNISGGGANLGNLEVTGTTISIANGASQSSILVGNGPAGLTLGLDSVGPAYLNLYANTYDTQTYSTGSGYTTGTYTASVGGGTITLTDATLIETYLNSISKPATITSLVINGTDTVPYDGASYGGGTVNLSTTTAPGVDPTTVTSILFNVTYQNQFLIDEDNGDYGIYLGDLNFDIQSTRDVNITAGDDLRLEATDIFSLTNNGDISFTTNANSSSFSWAFHNTGVTYFPTLTVDLHNGGNQSGQVLQFGDDTQQVIITGPTPPGIDVNAQRLIIQGQRAQGAGEGGDVYFWAGDADNYGGDIKIYAGDADNPSAGYGGYVNIEGGSGFDEGGYVRMTGGQSSNGAGAPASVIGGYGNTSGGDANLQGGQGTVAGGNVNLTAGYGGGGPGGNVTIVGGGSANGLSEYGNINLTAGASSWVFGNDGNLTLPSNNFDVKYANGDPVVFGSAAIGNVTFDNVTVQGVNQLNLSAGPDYTANLAYLQLRAGDIPSHIHLDTGDNAAYDLIIGNDDKFVQVSSTGNIIMSSYDSGNAVSYAMTLDTTGNLTLPGGNINLQPDEGFLSINTVFGGSISMDDGAGNTGAIGIESNGSGYINIDNGSGAKLWNFYPDGNLTTPGSILPGTANTFDIGDGTNYFRDAYFSNNVVAESFTTTDGGITHSGTAIGINANASKDVYIVADGGNTSWTFDTAGNLTLPGNTFAVNYANGTQVSLGGSSNISNGTSNVDIASSGGNVTVSVGGTSNVIVATTTGANVTGTLTTTGKIGYANGGTVTQTGTGQGVTLNQLTGQITLAKSSWTAGDLEIFNVNCNKVGTYDYVMAQVINGTESTFFNVVAFPYVPLANSFQIQVRALETTTTTPLVQFLIMKAAIS